MVKIDESRLFIPLKIAILTVSDTRTLEQDRSGEYLSQTINESGHELIDRQICKDEIAQIRTIVETYIARKDIDVIITTGGTGFTGRDVTPEAVEPLFEKRMDGFSTIFHQLSFKKRLVHQLFNHEQLLVWQMRHIYLFYQDQQARARMLGKEF